MSDWKTAYRSFYYATAEAPDDIQLTSAHTALLVIDVQNTYLEVDSDPIEAERWGPVSRTHEQQGDTQYGETHR